MELLDNNPPALGTAVQVPWEWRGGAAAGAPFAPLGCRLPGQVCLPTRRSLASIFLPPGEVKQPRGRWGRRRGRTGLKARPGVDRQGADLVEPDPRHVSVYAEVCSAELNRTCF